MGRARKTKEGQARVAKKVLPIHLDTREREILRRLGERDGCSMAEVVRRAIRKEAIDVIDPKALERPAAIENAR